ncbi:MAG: hypothetical protein ACOC2U_05015 [bacterium]
MKIKLLVGLKIPDTTAITTFRTLTEELNFNIQSLKRYTYYEFEIDQTKLEKQDIDKLKNKIANTDILVNSNKNTSIICEEFDNSLQGKSVIITELKEDNLALIKTLEKLGFNNIISIKKGVLWSYEADTETIKNATEELLYNKHYQKADYI